MSKKDTEPKNDDNSSPDNEPDFDVTALPLELSTEGFQVPDNKFNPLNESTSKDEK